MPGHDLFPNGFLKACGLPLFEALATIATASFRVGYFPSRFRQVNVAVLKKPGKSVQAYQTVGGWRPISLLCTMGKAIEAVIGIRIAEAAEERRLLPEGQMGNRKGRNTELAIRIVTETVYTAWKRRAVTSLLQLDIKGAFDTVNHVRLLDTMRSKGYPSWVVQWLCSYLEARTAVLKFDDETTDPIPIKAGVPQGSPLSPILFIIYIASLYENLGSLAGLLVVGFADDTNLLSFTRDVQVNRRRLEWAWQMCEEWARSRGMQFAPEKSELIHFTRSRHPIRLKLRLGDTEIEPRESARFSGVWLDRKLNFNEHVRKVKGKLSTQNFALTRLAASVWGCDLVRAREIYTKVIRNAVAYGASAFHTLTTEGLPKGAA